MTTFEPGARLGLTHGLRVNPFSTALFATSAAPIITDGFDVLVQEVIAAMTTAPWSRTTCVSSAMVTGVGVDVRPWAFVAADGADTTCESVGLAGSDAGNVSSTASSTE